MSKAEVKKENEQPKKDEKAEFVTIGEYFSEFLENKECRVIKFRPYGQMYAANPKTKKPARVSLGLPSEICNTDLRDLDKWSLTIVAVPRKLLLTEEKKKGDEKNNVKSRK